MPLAPTYIIRTHPARRSWVSIRCRRTSPGGQHAGGGGSLAVLPLVQGPGGGDATCHVVLRGGAGAGTGRRHGCWRRARKAVGSKERSEGRPLQLRRCKAGPWCCWLLCPYLRSLCVFLPVPPGFVTVSGSATRPPALGPGSCSSEGQGFGVSRATFVGDSGGLGVAGRDGAGRRRPGAPVTEAGSGEPAGGRVADTASCVVKGLSAAGGPAVPLHGLGPWSRAGAMTAVRAAVRAAPGARHQQQLQEGQGQGQHGQDGVGQGGSEGWDEGWSARCCSS